MDQSKAQENHQKDLRRGWFFLSLFILFILGGIITKRVFGHPEWMMAWHLPGAVFLVLGGKKFTNHQRKLYLERKFRVWNH